MKVFKSCCLFIIYFLFHFIKVATEAPDINYKSIKTIRIRLEDNATCNIGVHFDLVADKIGGFKASHDHASL